MFIVYASLKPFGRDGAEQGIEPGQTHVTKPIIEMPNFEEAGSLPADLAVLSDHSGTQDMSAKNASPATGPSNVQLGFIAWLLGLTASLANLLNFHNYDRPGFEVAILFVVFVIAACVITGIHKLAQPRLSFLFSAFFVTMLIDLNVVMEPGWFFLVMAAIALAALFQEKAVLKLTIAAFGTVLLFQTISLFTGIGKSDTAPNEAAIPQSNTTVNTQLRPIVHLVLDSYLGLEGMGVADTNFGTLQTEQNKFYLEHGFQIFPQAYSRHVKTVNSMPHFFSYGNAPLAKTVRNVQYTTAPRLDYFTDLDRKGYRTSALTPSFVDLCTNQPMTDCRNYNRSNLRSLLNTDLPATDRARTLGVTLLQLSVLTATVAEFIQHQVNDFFGTTIRLPHNRSKLFALTSFEKLDDVTKELEKLEYGEAHVVHLLLPHDPYSVDADCNILPEAEWLDEHGPAPLAARDNGYAEQVRCMTSRLGTMLEALEKTPAGRDAIVVIHGDHGSRTIDTVPYVGGPDLSLRDLALSYSTFFAIRIPGEEAASVQGRYALDSLLGEFARSGFTTAPRPQESDPEVYVMDALWIPKKREKLPDFSH